MITIVMLKTITYDQDTMVGFALEHFATISNWKEISGGKYALCLNDDTERQLVVIDKQTYFWRKIKNSHKQIRESELSPAGKTLIYSFVRTHYTIQ